MARARLGVTIYLVRAREPLEMSLDFSRPSRLYSTSFDALYASITATDLGSSYENQNDTVAAWSRMRDSTLPADTRRHSYQNVVRNIACTKQYLQDKVLGDPRCKP